MRLGRRVLPRHTLTGSTLTAEHEHLGEHLTDLDPAAIGHILRAVDRTARRINGPEQADEVEELLATQALTFDPDAVGRMADRVIAVVDPDGAAPARTTPYAPD